MIFPSIKEKKLFLVGYIDFIFFYPKIVTITELYLKKDILKRRMNHVFAAIASYFEEKKSR